MIVCVDLVIGGRNTVARLTKPCRERAGHALERATGLVFAEYPGQTMYAEQGIEFGSDLHSAPRQKCDRKLSWGDWHR